ncbi:MAG: hypothetical protein Q9211_006542, partial [Gyalolechia sp. 1 TL-2023]
PKPPPPPNPPRTSPAMEHERQVSRKATASTIWATERSQLPSQAPRGGILLGRMPPPPSKSLNTTPTSSLRNMARANVQHSIERRTPSAEPSHHIPMQDTPPPREKGPGRVRISGEDLRVLIRICVNNSATYGLPKQIVKWWKNVERQFATIQKKPFKNAKKRVEHLVKARKEFLASGKGDEKTPLNDALDDWIEIVTLHEDARRKIAPNKANIREGQTVETLPADITSVLSKKRNPAEIESLSDGTSESSDESDISHGNSRSKSRSKSSNRALLVTKRKKAKVEQEAKADAQFDRLMGTLDRVISAPPRPAVVMDPRIDHLEEVANETRQKIFVQCGPRQRQNNAQSNARRARTKPAKIVSSLSKRFVYGQHDRSKQIRATTRYADNEDVEMNMMDWYTSTANMACNSCSDHSCQDGCSRDRCTHACGGSSFCEEASVCMEEDCIGETCESSCNSGLGNCPSAMGAEDGLPATGQRNIHQAVGGGQKGSIHCPWILPGQPCDFMVDTRNALGKHIYEKHIDPQLTLKCPLDSCSEVVRKSNLPNHQAQQHQLDSYLCSWDDCVGPYPTSDELFNHITTSHGYLDCHFGGCEVSLRDPMQLQNHVFEDHLDYGFAWPNNPTFDQHFPPNNQFNFSDLSATIPPAGNFSVYENNGAHYPMQYLNPTSPYGRVHDNIPGSLERTTALVNTLREHNGTFADQVQPVWHDSTSVEKSQAKHDKDASSAHTTSRSAGSRTADTSSNHGSHSSGHVCRWIVEGGTKSLCNETFDTAETLQQHLRDVHCKPAKKSRLTPKVSAICHWAGCGRKGEPLTDTHKLIRHVLTHSDYREYKCSRCDKIFTTKGSVDTHERMVHTGEKPFKCEYCPKTTSNESQMGPFSNTSQILQSIMSTLADELLNDFEDSGSEAEREEEQEHGFLQESTPPAAPGPANGHKDSPSMLLDGDEEEESEDEDGLGNGAPKLDQVDDEEEAKAKVEKMQLGGVSDVRSVAGLMKTLEPVLEKVAYYQSLPPEKQNPSVGSVEDNPEYHLLTQANTLSTSIDNEIILVHKFIRDHYSTRFPELETLVTNPLDYAKTVAIIGNGPMESIKEISRRTDNLVSAPLRSILDGPTLMVVTVEATTTRGQELPAAELKTIHRACEMTLSLDRAKHVLTTYVQSRMNLFAPNLTALIGSLTAAQLLNFAGGLTGLAKTPSCNLPPLGSKNNKAQTGFATNVGVRHQGFLYHSPIISGIPADLKKQAMRIVAAKLVLAARVDRTHSSPDGSTGEELKQACLERLDKLTEPPPNKGPRALPAPDDRPSRKRGGRRARKAKEQTAMTELRKAQNRMAFGKEEKEVGYGTGDGTKGLGMIGQTNEGRIRALQIDQRTKAKLSKNHKGWGTSTPMGGGAGTASSLRGFGQSGNASSFGLRSSGVGAGGAGT